MPRKNLNNAFFVKNCAVDIAKNLLGKFLVRQIGKKEIGLMIAEVEVYDGFSDKASHASRGMTERNKAMFGEAGNWYVYFTYGMHWMLNLVVGPKNYPAAILIRGGVARVDNKEKIKLNGPAKLTKFLKIDKKLNGKPANKKTGLWIEDRGVKINPFGTNRAGNKIRTDFIIKNVSDRNGVSVISNGIKSAKRIGVDYAGPYWSRRKWRFYL